MKMRITLTSIIAGLLGAGLYFAVPFQVGQTITPHPKEVHLRNIRQLTSGGENAEAYLSMDNKRITFQYTSEPYKCDQILTINLDGSNVKLVITGLVRTSIH